MPWVQRHREKLRDEEAHHSADRYYSCGLCKAENSMVVRASWRCGFLPRKRWGPEKPRVPDGAPEDETTPSVCPGYSTTLPEVQEAARALSWRQDGLLRDYFDGAPVSERAKVYIDILASQIRETEAHAFRAIRRPKGG